MVYKSWFIHVHHRAKGHPRSSATFTHIWWTRHNTGPQANQQRTYTPSKASMRRLTRLLLRANKLYPEQVTAVPGFPTTSWAVKTTKNVRTR